MKSKQVIEATAVIARNLILGANLKSLSLVRHPKRIAEYASENLFFYKAFASKRGIPQKNVFEVLPSEAVESIKLGNLGADPQWFNSQASYTADLISLCLFCQIIKPRVVFEIGTLNGFTALHFALNTPENSEVYSLDLPKEFDAERDLQTTLIDEQIVAAYMRTERYCFEYSDVASKISCLFGDSANFDYSPFFGKVDLFFIDGAHSYDYVRSDTLNALECCHPGSVIAWHDFGRMGLNGVSDWILELSETYDVYSIPGGSIAFMVVE